MIPLKQLRKEIKNYLTDSIRINFSQLCYHNTLTHYCIDISTCSIKTFDDLILLYTYDELVLHFLKKTHILFNNTDLQIFVGQEETKYLIKIIDSIAYITDEGGNKDVYTLNSDEYLTKVI